MKKYIKGIKNLESGRISRLPNYYLFLKSTINTISNPVFFFIFLDVENEIIAFEKLSTTGFLTINDLNTKK